MKGRIKQLTTDSYNEAPYSRGLLILCFAGLFLFLSVAETKKSQYRGMEKIRHDKNSAWRKFSRATAKTSNLKLTMTTFNPYQCTSMTSTKYTSWRLCTLHPSLTTNFNVCNLTNDLCFNYRYREVQEVSFSKNKKVFPQYFQITDNINLMKIL